MNINYKFLLLGTSLSLIPNLTYAQCAVTDCQQLGYTSLKSCDGGLKCPFGEYWACPEAEQKATLGECTGYAKNCSIGQILNSDGTCTTDVTSGKTPIGVVVAIKDNCGYAMTAEPIKTGIQWSTEFVNTGVFQSSGWNAVSNDFNVSGNMAAIIQTSRGNSNKYPAAYAALNYAPNDAPTTKGKWALPTAGILNSLHTNLNAINNTIFKLGGTKLSNDNTPLWSSSEYNDHGVWHFWASNFNDRIQSGVDYYGKSGNLVVRPVLSF